MRKLKLSLVIVASAVLFYSCKLDKMIKLAQENDLQVNPDPLEVHGGNIPVEMSAVLPPKMLPANTSFTLNTIYQYGDQEVAVGSVEFKAEDFPNSSETTSRRNENFEFPYSEGMNPGTLYIEGVATDLNSGKSKSTERMDLAKGLILTSEWVQDVAMTSYADHRYVDREELVPTNVVFYFDQGKSNLRTSLLYDGKSNASKRDKLSAFIAEKNVTRTVTITGTHSPEGTEVINADLSKNRAKTIENYYRGKMDQYNYKGAADSIEFIIKPVVQDWNPFRTALAEYNGIDDSEKAQFNAIIKGSGSFEEKEKEFQKIPSFKKVFDEVYPGLRTAKTEVLTVKPKKTNAEIAILAKAITNGEASTDTLTHEELMYSATLTPSPEEKAAIYKVVADATGIWEAHNNLGVSYLEMGNLDKAATQFEIAANKNAESTIVKANMGALQVLQKDYEKAYATLSKSTGGSNEVVARVNAMKGALEVRMAMYDEAKASFASSASTDATNLDKGLAFLLSKDYAQAGDAFNQVAEGSDLSGITNYLMAVNAARTNNAEEVGINLKKAVQIDPTLKNRALSDMEFSQYLSVVNEAVK